jgi:hypothetical protein
MQNNFVVPQDYPNNKVNSLFFQIEYMLVVILLASANVLKCKGINPYVNNPLILQLYSKWEGLMLPLDIYSK